MAKYILRPRYGDMDVVVLGSSVKTIIKKLRTHWEDELENPEDYFEDTIYNINFILSEEYDSIEDLMEDYNKRMDEDYTFEETY